MLELDNENVPSLVVGIGVSTGGQDTLKAFFAHVPETCGLAFVVVAYPESSHNASLQNLIADVTALPLRQVTDEMPLQANAIYLPPLGSTLTLVDGFLQVSNPAAKQPTALLDVLFQSLARNQNLGVVGILMSGAGSDGAQGLKAIADAGGMTMAQDTATARYDSMPYDAMALSIVDHVLAPADMPAQLLNYARYVSDLRRAPERDHDSLQTQIEQRLADICDILRDHTDHDFKHYKKATLVRRIERRLRVQQLNRVESYIERLQVDANEKQALFKELLIGVTAFFRDTAAFDALAREVIPDLLQHSGNEPVRVWVPGCASGEEAYTLAMLFLEAMERLKRAPNLHVFATDIDEQGLRLARQGQYPESIAEHLAPHRLQRFFVKQGRKYHVTKELREVCLFSSHNLVSDPPFSRLNLISCRNLLIYLGSHLQKKLISVFNYALRPGGYLFLGAAEGSQIQKDLFGTVDAKHRIFVRRETVIDDANIISVLNSSYVERSNLNSPAPSMADIGAVAQRIVLDEFAPSYAIVSAEGEVHYLSAGVANYLEPATGYFSNNVIKMARTGLRAGLRSALDAAVKVCRKVADDSGLIDTPQGMQRVTLIVQPMPDLGEDSNLLMVVFKDSGLPLVQREKEGDTASADPLSQQLERELVHVRRELERTVKELEATKQESRASNEELLSMNEELRSTNEELETAKTELEASNIALEQVNVDLENLLEGIQIATIFLDRRYHIRRFTPAVTQIYNVIPDDIGRPLAHITHHVAAMPPLPTLEQMEQETGPIRHEIQTHEGQWYLRRVLPYVLPGRDGDGLVITFTDITELKRSEEALREAAHYKDEYLAVLAHELRNPLAPLRNATQVLQLLKLQDTKLQDLRDIIDRQVGHMAHMLDDLLDVSRITRGKVKITRDRLDLVTLVRQVAEDFRGAVEAEKLSLSLQTPASALWIEGDNTRLSQVLGNLLRNAIKFSTRGGLIAVTVEEDEQAFSVVVRVRDNGIGMSAELLTHVFEPFRQGERGTSRSSAGLGLGLALVKGFIELHGGSVEAESAGPMQGSEFILRLPLVQTAPKPVQEPAPAAVEMALRILIIDDMRDTADTLRVLLEYEGYEVGVAYSGEEGLTRVHELHPHIVLCDIGLPQGMDGYGVARAIRHIPALGKSVYLIAVTGYGRDKDRDKALTAGFDDHLIKPVDFESLKSALAKWRRD